jgi:putative two-component system response regulator
MASRKIILAIDDMAENLTLMRSMLEEYFDIRLAKSAKMALELLDNLRVDLILLDIEMPGMTGFEFLEQFTSRHPDNKKTPVIFVTSHADKDFINRAINAGAKDYLLKPLKASALYKKIDTVIGMPETKTIHNPLEEKLNDLFAVAGSGDGTRAEILAKELNALAIGQNSINRNYVREIVEMIGRYEYDKAIKKIKEFQEYLLANKK